MKLFLLWCFLVLVLLWVSEREKNRKEYNECNNDPWVEDEESPHFLDDDDEGEEEKRSGKEKTCLGSYWIGWNCN